MNNKKFHYAWIVMIGCALTQIGSLGAVVYSVGAFYGPVSEALGVGRGDVALSQTILALVQAFSLPFVGKFIAKRKLNVAMGIAGIGFAGGYALLSLYDSIYPWYITTAFMGFCGAFIAFLPVPMLINSWFQKKSGLALGISTACGGLGGAILTPVASSIIESQGYHTAFLVMACISAAFITLPALLLIRNKPSDMGLEPYGAGEGSSTAAAAKTPAGELEGVPYAEAVKSKNYYFIFIACALLGTLAVYSTHMVGYADTLGYAGAVGASLSSIVMIGTLVSKLGLGALKDKFGAKTVVSVCGVLVSVMMFAVGLAGGVSVVLYVGSFIVGTGAAIASLSPAWTTRIAFGSRDYGRILSNMTMAYTLFMGLYTGLVGYIYDWTSSYTPAFVASGVCGLLAVALMRAATAHKEG